MKIRRLEFFKLGFKKKRMFEISLYAMSKKRVRNIWHLRLKRAK